MKRFLIVLVIAANLVNVHSEWDSIKKECVKELHLNETLTRMLDDNIVVPEKNVDYHKFLQCYWEKKHLIDEHGYIYWKTVTEDLSSRLTKKVGDTVPYSGSKMPTQIAVRLAIMECGNLKLEGKSNGHIAVKVQNCVGELIK